jgi:hypothetical protein
MGRSYWFECSKCGYRATVSGGADEGLNFRVQTVVCRDCQRLYDAVTQIRVPDERTMPPPLMSWKLRPKLLNLSWNPKAPPSFQFALNRLPYRGVRRFKWQQYKLQCPVSTWHRVRSWSEPDRCPRCGLHLEKNAVPYRIWE